MEGDMDTGIIKEAPQISAFGSSVKAIEGKLARPIDRTERKAAAFLFDRKWRQDLTPDGFLQGLSVMEDDQGNSAAWKIRSGIHNESMEEIKRRMGENTTNPAEISRLQALKEFIETGQKLAERAREQNPQSPVRIGAVPGDWVPSWLAA